MKLIVGLGNPGDKYKLTRHNIGFMAIDAMAQSFGADSYKGEHKSLTTRISVNSEVILLAKPQTFMNLSGEAVQSLMAYYRIEIQDLMIAHDEIDLPFGTMRFQTHRGHGGHNGIRSIHQTLATNEYKRIRLGVGRPPHEHMEIADYVLQNFNSSEMNLLPDFLNLICEGVECSIKDGFEKAASRYNR